ncbi:lysine exporter LysO family protein [Clostridium formicaceticum]|uniref:Lysine exporter LysO family protein n=1 Tax=Clostridium formicaceticum TaxID=1497 RepID=A0AAC9RI68_9CLOT|nr:lysine exporter LysO family protein [Clostridium formicaceticum]AOY77008.1 hypothetical protein BJL90_14780 [Clostridium formicaceticum]ARE87499.1 hypothetical protein CLFO_18990 [Clostridium formicaceticum]
MTFKIMLSVVLGILLGIWIFPQGIEVYMGTMIDIGLCLLLFFVGMDIGKQGDLFNKIKKIGFKVLWVPFMIAVGSITGTILGGILLRIPMNEAAAIGAGFGWYSLSAIELSKHSAELGALAFITNVSREVIAIISIPFIARYIGKLEAIAPAGATAMDTTLPIIAKSTDGNTAMISFLTGVVLSSLVPILVPALMIVLK